MRLQLRPARPADAPRLTRIACAAKRFWGYPEAWIALWKAALTLRPAHLRRHTAVVALERGRIAGFASVRIAAATASLEHLWVAPGAIGRGIGAALLRAVARVCVLRRVRTLEIVADPNAAGFYRALGARPAGSVRSVPAPRNLPRLRLRPVLGSRPGDDLKRRRTR